MLLSQPEHKKYAEQVYAPGLDIIVVRLLPDCVDCYNIQYYKGPQAN